MKLFVTLFLLTFQLCLFGNNCVPAFIAIARSTAKSLLAPRKIRCDGFCAKTARTYNEPKIAQFSFTPEGLSQLSSFYRTLSVPSLIFRDFNEIKQLHSRINSQEYRNLFRWFSKESTYITPNPGSINFSELAELSPEQRKTLKDRPQGVAVITYFVHPGLIDAQNGPREQSQGFPKLLEPAQIRMGELEKKTEDKYLISLLDLRSEHLPYLRKLQKEMTSYLKEVYGYDEQKDDFNLFFHFPYAEPTATLHLHGRLNFPTHALDAIVSYSLQDVITHLESGKDIKQLVLDRQTALGGHLYNYISKIGKLAEESKATEIKIIDNPFLSEISNSEP